MKKRVADIIIDTLADNGITDAFCVVGGGAMYLNNALGITDRIKTYFNHHEQACAMCAEGYAKYTQNKPALVCVTTGPGGTNTLTGVMGAYQDSVPMIIISGQVRYDTTIAQSGLNIRRRGEQEFDIVNSVKNMTKYSKMVTDPLSIKQEVQKAYDIAMEGRRGPVWLDIPLNVQSAEVEEKDLYPINSNISYITPSTKDFEEVIELLTASKRPSILAGSAIRSAGVHKDFVKCLDENLHIPAVNASCMADIVPPNYEMFGSSSGMISSRIGNFILQNSDVILILGCSLGYKQTGFAQENFAPNAKIIMVDVNPDEAKKPGLNIYKFLHSDLKIFFELCGQVKINANPDWKEYVQKLNKRFPPYGELETLGENSRVDAMELWHQLSQNAEDNAIFVLGNSSSNGGILIYPAIKPSQRVIVNVNCGSMGDDIPLATGVSIAAKRPVYLISGDGSLMMNIQELATIKHNKIPVKIIAFSNNGYGNIVQTCKNYFNGKNVGCTEESLSFPDFGKLAEAFGIKYLKCKNTGEITNTIDIICKENSAIFTEVLQLTDNRAFPRVTSKYNSDGTFERPKMEDMAPFLSAKEMEELMINNREDIKC